MSFVRGDICYIVENNRIVRPAKVVRRQGGFYVIQLTGTCGAIKLSENRLFKTEDDARNSMKIVKVDKDVKVTQDIQDVIPDVFEGKRRKINHHIFD